MQHDHVKGASLAEMIDFAERPRSEISQVIDMCASAQPHEFSMVEIQQLAFERITHRLEQQLLTFFLDSNETNKEKYLCDMVSLTRRFSARNREILGAERFYVLFGEAGDEPDGLIDKSIFLSSGPSQ